MTTAPREFLLSCLIFYKLQYCIVPRNIDLFCIVNYYIKNVKTSWACSIVKSAAAYHMTFHAISTIKRRRNMHQNKTRKMFKECRDIPKLIITVKG